jgi:SnoaL-like domain
MSEWCLDYKRAWETQDAALFVGLFTPDCEYRETPFSEPVPGSAFYDFWQALAQTQRDNHIDLEILGWASGSRAILRWDATTNDRQNGEHSTGSGVFLLTFSADDRCSDVREWQHWHRTGDPLEPSFDPKTLKLRSSVGTSTEAAVSRP